MDAEEGTNMEIQDQMEQVTNMPPVQDVVEPADSSNDAAGHDNHNLASQVEPGNVPAEDYSADNDATHVTQKSSNKATPEDTAETAAALTPSPEGGSQPADGELVHGDTAFQAEADAFQEEAEMPADSNSPAAKIPTADVLHKTAAGAAETHTAADAVSDSEQAAGDVATPCIEPTAKAELAEDADLEAESGEAASKQARQPSEPADAAIAEAEAASKLASRPASSGNAAPEAATAKIEAPLKQASRPVSSSHNAAPEAAVKQYSRPVSSSPSAVAPAEVPPVPDHNRGKEPAALIKEAEAVNEDTAEHHNTVKPRTETAAERLTTPTAMRMLKTLQQTQGDKIEWHIASGVVFKSKKLNEDEMTAMVDRLCVAKHQDDNMPAKPHAVKLVYEGNKETYVPVKEATKEENINYMSELYSRCQETRKKTQQELADKYLQPLVKPKSPGKSPANKAAVE